MIETQKTQLGRWWSIFGFSMILLIVAGMPVIPNFWRVVLVVMGLATIYTVGKIYLENKNREK